LKALAEHSELGALLPADGATARRVHAVRQAGIDIGALATQLQEEGAQFVRESWYELLEVIASKSAALARLVRHMDSGASSSGKVLLTRIIQHSRARQSLSSP